MERNYGEYHPVFDNHDPCEGTMITMAELYGTDVGTSHNANESSDEEDVVLKYLPDEEEAEKKRKEKEKEETRRRREERRKQTGQNGVKIEYASLEEEDEEKKKEEERKEKEQMDRVKQLEIRAKMKIEAAEAKGTKANRTRRDDSASNEGRRAGIVQGSTDGRMKQEPREPVNATRGRDIKTDVGTSHNANRRKDEGGVVQIDSDGEEEKAKKKRKEEEKEKTQRRGEQQTSKQRDDGQKGEKRRADGIGKNRNEGDNRKRIKQEIEKTREEPHRDDSASNGGRRDGNEQGDGRIKQEIRGFNNATGGRDNRDRNSTEQGHTGVELRISPRDETSTRRDNRDDSASNEGRRDEIEQGIDVRIKQEPRGSDNATRGKDIRDGNSTAQRQKVVEPRSSPRDESNNGRDYRSHQSSSDGGGRGSRDSGESLSRTVKYEPRANEERDRDGYRDRDRSYNRPRQDDGRNGKDTTDGRRPVKRNSGDRDDRDESRHNRNEYPGNDDRHRLVQDGRRRDNGSDDYSRRDHCQGIDQSFHDERERWAQRLQSRGDGNDNYSRRNDNQGNGQRFHDDRDRWGQYGGRSHHGMDNHTNVQRVYNDQDGWRQSGGRDYGLDHRTNIQRFQNGQEDLTQHGRPDHGMDNHTNGQRFYNRHEQNRSRDYGNSSNARIYDEPDEKPMASLFGNGLRADGSQILYPESGGAPGQSSVRYLTGAQMSAKTRAEEEDAERKKKRLANCKNGQIFHSGNDGLGQCGRQGSRNHGNGQTYDDGRHRWGQTGMRQDYRTPNLGYIVGKDKGPTRQTGVRRFPQIIRRPTESPREQEPVIKKEKAGTAPDDANNLMTLTLIPRAPPLPRYLDRTPSRSPGRCPRIKEKPDEPVSFTFPFGLFHHCYNADITPMLFPEHGGAPGSTVPIPMLTAKQISARAKEEKKKAKAKAKAEERIWEKIQIRYENSTAPTPDILTIE